MSISPATSSDELIENEPGKDIVQGVKKPVTTLQGHLAIYLLCQVDGYLLAGAHGS